MASPPMATFSVPQQRGRPAVEAIRGPPDDRAWASEGGAAPFSPGIARRRLNRESGYTSERGVTSALALPSSDRALGEAEGALHLVLVGPSSVHA